MKGRGFALARPIQSQGCLPILGWKWPVAVSYLQPLSAHYLYGACYFLDSPPLWQLTAANLETKGGGFVVILLWCAMLLLFRSVVASMPKKPIVQPVFWGESRCKQCGNAAAWLAWFCILTILSLPSILYAIAQSSPTHTTLLLDDDMLQWLHRIAPYLTVCIDISLADEASARYSAWTGLRIDHLLMTFRLFSAWLLALLTTMALDENCLSG